MGHVLTGADVYRQELWSLSTFERDRLYGFHVKAADGGVVAEIYPQPWLVHVNEDSARAIAAVPEMVQALEAAQQCIADFIEVYKHGGSVLVMDEAVKSLRTDVLKRVNEVLAKIEGGKE